MDFLLALLALIALSPILIVIALAVALDSTGSPLYLAWRVGQGGKLFRMWKFRTMVVGADRMGSAITVRKDPRITRVGQFLRATKFDELPQFVNVLIGDMSLVGPRPEAPEIVSLYTAEQRTILAVKPGITGRVQLESGEESDSIPEHARADEYYVQHMLDRKLRSDMEYLNNRTAIKDIQIIFSTTMYVLRVCARHLVTIF
jgi:lipopolysaccharide/colanic/teichoic acid biosynthesis glycosyltransferase